MNEQANGATQITSAAEQMRQQSDQAAKALKEQTRTIKEMSGVGENIAKQIALITRANREHSVGSSAILDGLIEIRQIAERSLQEDDLRKNRWSLFGLFR
jgi:methyl-accepting chemotaxis protein